MSYDSNFERQSYRDVPAAPFVFHSTSEDSRAFSESSAEPTESAKDLLSADQLPGLSLTDGNSSMSPEVVFSYPTVKTSDNLYKTGIDVETTPQNLAVPEKLHNFIAAAYRNATAPSHYEHYFNSEMNKFAGIGEGLKIATETTKHMAAEAWTAVTDGTVVHVLSKPNAINDPLFTAATDSLDACASDRDAVNHLLERGLQATLKASEHYTNLPDQQKGQVIGQVMFGLINPNGSLRAATDGFKILDSVATHVDARLIKGLQSSKSALDTIRQVGPELALQSKQVAHDLLKMPRLTGKEFEYAGVPRDYVNFTESKPAEFDHFKAMSNSERVTNSNGFERLRRTDLGKPRQPYDWECINEQFSDDVLRQTNDLSCVSAVGEMLSGGKLAEADLIQSLETPSDLESLAPELGPNWTTEKGPTSLAEIGKNGSWATELLPDIEPGHFPMGHAVIVDGLSASGNLVIRDSWEGTIYEMPISLFLKRWSGRALYRTMKD